ncbi:LysM repeat protein [Chitinophaga terrae (ex Kim and Jung 2007)]|uniref:glucosaminidase domain-containing protein n=1 Tax=Chitinophaga terrae (ex Kim and Jung 2007) TaxID=408074 RepID=UPI002785ACCB|nr:glucosaminidase domain-containing protein [Chitinophaga terrae (ex Kim and Jung 2007)]MDQ0107731.1 LysM repeat protein [Chitinophaga terrae (ex Kim and Jung 2007)]
MQVRKFLLLTCFLIGFVNVLFAQKITTQQYIATYRNLAIEEMRRTGVPAAIKLAQGIVETQSGNGTLCLQSNNHFGIKCKNTWTGKTIKYDDDEAQECFRVYESARDSYRDHSDFLRSNPRYAFLFQFDGDDYKSWAYGLKQAGYATNKTYPQQLIKVIEDYNLQQYSLIAMGKIKAPSDAFPGTDTYAEAAPRETRPSSSAPSRSSSGTAKATSYPKGIFEINGRKAIYAKAGASLIQLANQYNKKLRKLVKYNDLDNDNSLAADMIIFLEKKSKKGAKEFHSVANGETMHSVAQAEGIQLRWLRRRNKMNEGEEPAAGQRLTLDGFAKSAPALSKNTRVIREEDKEPPSSVAEVVEDAKEEIAKAATPPPARETTKPAAEAPGGVPVAMIEDLKKAGTVTTSSTPKATPPPAPAPAPKPAAGNPVKYHDVQPKETLYGIAKMYNKSVTQLQQWNNLENFDIKIGQRLVVNK